MKIDMAAQDGEYFNIGSIVSCTTCYNQKIQGEVLAFDEGTKMLAIKSTAASGKRDVHDIKMVNLSFVKHIKVTKECNDPPPPLTSISIQKIQSRLRQNLDEKRRQVNYIGIGVTPEGQRAFNSIVKTLNEVRWNGKDIVVMDEVKIVPPYGPENCTGKEGQLLNHVKKILQKHHTEESQKSEQRKSASPVPTAS